MHIRDKYLVNSVYVLSNFTNIIIIAIKYDMRIKFPLQWTFEYFHESFHREQETGILMKRRWQKLRGKTVAGRIDR